MPWNGAERLISSSVPLCVHLFPFFIPSLFPLQVSARKHLVFIPTILMNDQCFPGSEGSFCVLSVLSIALKSLILYVRCMWCVLF